MWRLWSCSSQCDEERAGGGEGESVGTAVVVSSCSARRILLEKAQQQQQQQPRAGWLAGGLAGLEGLFINVLRIESYKSAGTLCSELILPYRGLVNGANKKGG